MSTPSIPQQFNNNNPSTNSNSSIIQKFKLILNYLPIANKSISSTESIIISIFDLILSRFLLNLIIPLKELNYLNFSTLLLNPFSIHSNLPNILPNLLFKFKKESIFWKSILAASLIASLHELTHLGIIWLLGGDSWKSSKKIVGSRRIRAGRGAKVDNSSTEIEDEEEKIWGIEIRGRRLLLPSSTTSTSNDESECAICLRSKSSTSENLSTSIAPSTSTSKEEEEEEEDPLEIFCTSCSIPIHRSCLLQWWDAVQSSLHPNSTSSDSNNNNNSNIDEEEVREARSDIYQINIGGTLMWTTFRITSTGHTTANNNQMTSSSSRSNNANSTPQILGDDLPSAGVWGLGPVSLLVSNDQDKEGRTTIKVSPAYIQARESNASGNNNEHEDHVKTKEKWYWEFSSEKELERVRNLLIANKNQDSSSSEFDQDDTGVAGESSKDPLIAIVESHKPGPNCPNCRSDLKLKIYLVSSLPSSTSTISSTSTSYLINFIKTSTHSLIKKLKILQMIEVVRRLSNIWKNRFGILSFGEKLLISGIVRIGLRSLCGS